MTLKNDVELANTKRKLCEVEAMIEQAKGVNGSGRDTEVRSLSRLANQMREEIIRYQGISTLNRAK
jgi:hypothetical protein